MSLSRFLLGPHLFVLTAIAALAQTTTNVTFDVNLVATGQAAENVFVIAAGGSAGSLGNLGLRLSGIAPIQANGFGTPVQFTGGLYFNTVDVLNLSFTINDLSFFSPQTQTFSFSSGAITGGTGIYSGATGSLTLNFNKNSDTVTIAGSGSLTLGGKTTPLTLTNFVGTASDAQLRYYTVGTVSGALNPLGTVTGTAKFDNTAQIANSSAPDVGILNVAINTNDSINVYLPDNGPLSFISGGTGLYQGAFGSFTTTSTTDIPNGSRSQGTGTIMTPAAGAPIITQVKTAFGATAIANNTWLQINGTNLAPANTPSTGLDWSNAPEFAGGKMPTKLGAIDGVTVNGNAAYIYFYCSAATDPSCPADQINVLSPLDQTTGPIPVVVTRNGVASAPFIVTKNAFSPTLPLFDVKGHVVARHLDFSLMGPPDLFPGATTPARVGETVILVAYGLGLPATPLTEGSSSQSGSLPVTPACRISGISANVSAAVISPGLYQLNVTIPPNTPSGDNPIHCNYQGFFTAPGPVIAVQ